MDWENFCQSNPPPQNAMIVGQLVEARDSRARSKALLLTSHSRQNASNTPRVSLPAEFTLGRVVAVQGPRVCVHMLGTDDMHDQWFLCDSEDIRPVGQASPSKLHSPLHPPQAFRGDPAHYSRFVARAKERYPTAPPDAFKPPPKAPQNNRFAIGDKIEAVDLSYPAFICPATVRELAGNYLRVGFDGWREGFDYWTRYDSRDIFPSGWCTLVGHELQSPGAHEQSRNRKSYSTSISSKAFTTHNEFQPNEQQPQPISVKIEIPSVDSVSPQRSISPSHEKKRKTSKKLKVSSSPPRKSTSSCDISLSVRDSLTSQERMEIDPEPPVKKKSSHKEKRLKKTKSLKLKVPPVKLYLSNIRNSMSNDQVNSSESPPKMSSRHEDPNPLSPDDHPSSSLSVSTDRETCLMKISPSMQTKDPFPTNTVFSGGNTNFSSILCEQTRQHSESTSTTSLNRIFSSTSDRENEMPQNYSQWAKEAPSMASSSSPVGNSSQSRYSGCIAPSSKSLMSTDVISRDLYVLSDGRKLPDDPAIWSVDDVFRYLMDRESPFSSIAHIMRDAEVDGMALLLLKIDTLTKYLHIKLGPALKLKHTIQELSRNASEILPDLSNTQRLSC